MDVRGSEESTRNAQRGESTRPDGASLPLDRGKQLSAASPEGSEDSEERIHWIDW